MNKGWVYGIGLTLCIVILVVLTLFIGAVKIPVKDVYSILMRHEATKESWRFIVWETRFPQAITALLSGSSLSVCGLMLQTAFRNPLAGPSIFGMSNGASLGVALVMLLLGGSVTTNLFTITGFVAILVAAFVGAMVVTGIIYIFSNMVRNSVMLLIVGMMIGYLASSAITLLNFFATQEGVKSYLVWGMGNFGAVSLKQLPLYSSVTIVGLMGAIMLIKPLNVLLLGEHYAKNLGVRVVSVRNWLLIITGLLTAITTAFCGPIAFIGLTVPHIARLLIQTENQRILMPITLLLGAVVALVCNLLCYLPGDQGIIPLNAVTPLIGAPVIIYVAAKYRNAV